MNNSSYHFDFLSQGPKSLMIEFVSEAGKERKKLEYLAKDGEATITNNTNRLNIVSPSVSAARKSFDNNDLPTDPLMPDLEDFTLSFRVQMMMKNVEPKKVIQALTDPSWIEAMQEELLQFKLQKVWILVDLPKGKRANGTKSMIGSLMYLTALRPDITFAACACARFQVTPKTSHLHAVKRIFGYLKGQPKLGLWYPRDSPFDLEAFSDSDYARASLNRKSTTRGCQFLSKRLISWQCKKQTIVANSITEAEYVAAAN
ncbi:hypothetical protein Tco_0060148 [Tanacetum coccineum]